MANRLRAYEQIQDKDRYITISETKRQMVSMLTELQTEIEELDTYDIERVHGLIENGYISTEVENLIQQRIDKLKEKT